MRKKFFALILAAVMCLGMSMTAFAATNDSPSVPNESPEVSIGDTFANRVYSNVKIAAGQGSIQEITEEDLQAIILERVRAIGQWDYFEEYEFTFDYTFGDTTIQIPSRPYVFWSYGFDVQGIESGQVTVQLQDQGNVRISDHIGHLVYVSHYNMETEEWETMDQFAQIDENGCVTFEFESYSPVILSILTVTADDLENRTNEEVPVDVLDTTYTPQQVVAEAEDPTAPGSGTTGGADADNGTGGQAAGESTEASTAPKTGDSVFGIAVLLVGVMAVCGAVLSRKKAF